MKDRAIIAASSTLLSAALTMALLGSSAPLGAETILVGEQLSVRDSKLARPAAGITMKEVEAQFGAPQSRHPSVGEPPITRWDYEGFSVFFEHDRVIHAVVAPAAAASSAMQTTSASSEAPANAEATTPAAASTASQADAPSTPIETTRPADTAGPDAAAPASPAAASSNATATPAAAPDPGQP